MSRNLRILLFISVLIAVSSCDSKNNDPQPNKIEILNGSTWLGGVEREMTDYDVENNMINRTTSEIPEGDYHLFVLHPDNTSLIKYRCDNVTCSGDEYNGKWSLTNNTLKITINREEFNSLADAIFLEAEIAYISNTELIVETIVYSPVQSVNKRISRIKFTKREQ